MAWWFLFGELRGIAGLAAIYLVTGGPLGRRLAPAPAAGLRPAHPLGAQPPGGRARAVRPDVRDRGPRAGRTRAGAHPHPAREHHRQRAPRRRDRPRARARPALRDQARAGDDPDDRHRRALGAHELRAPRLRPTRPERWLACAASRTTSARARASSSTRRARATPPRSSPARRSHRRAPAGDRAAGQPPAQCAPAAPRRAAGAARREPRGRRGGVRARRVSTASSTSATSGPAASSAPPCACASGALPRRRCPPASPERIAWLYERWQVLDDWIGRQRADTSAD